ncbi:MAG: hypothetical protein ABIH76_07230 [Candidatus Bathyarchaeota archaeon]
MNPTKLDKCENFGDVFELVKASVETTLKQHRGGLMLYLADLSPSIGALHGLGSNGIVINRLVFNTVSLFAKSKSELYSFLYAVLLHEYLHSLGYVDELDVRRLTLKVAEATFGADHLTTTMAMSPMAFFPRLANTDSVPTEENVELIKDFDRTAQRYFV